MSSCVKIETAGHVGHLTLERPQVLNSLDYEMVVSLRRALEAWRDDPAVHTVVITGAGERAFCAGGDLLLLRDSAVTGSREAMDFWHDEYLLNLVIATYPKPVVPVMDGIVLGGGVGISAHASHRVATERSMIGMPETGIGFFPDVGGTWLLSRLDDETGMHLALTGAPVGAADAVHAGLADQTVPAERVPDLLDRLTELPVDKALADLAVDPGPSPLSVAAGWITACYSAPDPRTAVQRLRSHPDKQARAAAAMIATRSPISVAVTFRALRDAKGLPSLADALVRELRIAARFLDQPDLVEGIRAAVVDKDRDPRWRAPSLESIDADVVDGFFAPLPDDLELSVVSLRPRRA